MCTAAPLARFAYAGDMRLGLPPWPAPMTSPQSATTYVSEPSFSNHPPTVRLANLKKISSSVLLGDWFQRPYGRRKGDWEEKKREYDGRWWTPRGQNPWAWAFGTP